MRAGPLSNPQVIDLLNRHFVPVYVVNEDYSKNGPAPDEEKAERLRIYREAREAGLSTGTVHAYVLEASGQTIDSLHVADAARDDRLIRMLDRAIEATGVRSGDGPVVEPRSISAPPEARTGSVVLHLTARGQGSSWDGFPSENWIVLGPDRLEGLLPVEDVEAVQSWEVRDDVAEAILTHFYPQTENNDVSTHRFDRRSLRGEIVEIKDGWVRARIKGDLRMTHPFYPGREDGNVVEARIVGLLDFEPGSRQVRRFLLTTDGATYGKGTLDVALRSIP
ncbi:hypothetical protein BH23PLA1_BH23PLA1_02620 [soil metagenome]